MATTSKVREAVAGDTVSFWGDETTVREACTQAAGSWYCETHDESFRGNWMVTSHSDDNRKHVLVWVCADHGPEASGVAS